MRRNTRISFDTTGEEVLRIEGDECKRRALVFVWVRSPETTRDTAVAIDGRPVSERVD